MLPWTRADQVQGLIRFKWLATLASPLKCFGHLWYVCNLFAIPLLKIIIKPLVIRAESSNVVTSIINDQPLTQTLTTKFSGENGGSSNQIMISDYPLISGGIPAHGTSAVVSQPQWVEGAVLPIWPGYLHTDGNSRLYLSILKGLFLDTQNGSIVFGCSHFTCVIWHCISLDSRLFWPGEKKVWGIIVFGSVINVTQMLVAWCGVLSFINTGCSILAHKLLPGKVFLSNFFAWQEGSGVPCN